jgi:hypothetical protein
MPRKRRWLKWLIRIGGALLLLLAAFLAWVFLACVADPPELDYEPAILAAGAPVKDGERMRLGKCWFEERKGRSLLYLEGDPYSIGYANANLTAKLLATQERHFVQTVKGFFSNRLELFLVGIAVLVNNRNLPDYVPREYAEEILGIAEGCPDPFPEYSTTTPRTTSRTGSTTSRWWAARRLPPAGARRATGTCSSAGTSTSRPAASSTGTRSSRVSGRSGGTLSSPWSGRGWPARSPA